MHIKNGVLHTDRLEETKRFYTEKMGLGLLSDGNDTITLSVGTSTLSFEASFNQRPVYLFNFLKDVVTVCTFSRESCVLPELIFTWPV
jgi:catechol 2,3-dioxygenase-like lactoylglutathione lyase family enzyme